MSEKIVKVTNGKILNYKISAPNYKTIYGSKLITADSTISHNMIAEDDPNGVYLLGDRIGNIATFLTYYTDSNNQTYAVFVADAQYRTSTTWGVPGSLTGMPTTDNPGIEMSGSPYSATYCTDYIVNTYGSSINNYPAFKHCNDLTISSLNLSAKMPNPYEVYQMYVNRTLIDEKDPTASTYSSLTLSTWKNTSTCYEYNQYAIWVLLSNVIWDWNNKGNPYLVAPVFEIPVN